jgi:hypothetical protein
MLSNISIVIICDRGEGSATNLVNNLSVHFTDIILIYNINNTDKIIEFNSKKIHFNNKNNSLNINLFCKNNWIFIISDKEILTTELISELSYIFYSNLQDRYKSYLFNIGLIIDNNYHHINRKARLFNNKYIEFDLDNITTLDNDFPQYLLNNNIITHMSYKSLQELRKKNIFENKLSTKIISKFKSIFQIII